MVHLFADGVVGGEQDLLMELVHLVMKLCDIHMHVLL